MSLFRLDASIRAEGSVSRAIADLTEEAWRRDRREAPVTRRHIGLEPLPSTAWALSVHAQRGDPATLTDAHRQAAALARALVDELVDAEAFLFAVPLYNFGISQHFKAWVDMVLTEPRMAAGTAPLLAGRPAVLVVVRGGSYGPGTPREGWDHASGWIRRILEDVWKLDLRIVETEFTLAGQSPALNQFIEVAEEMRRESDRLASAHGAHLSRGLGSNTETSN